MEANNDNDFDTFQPIAIALAKVVRRLSLNEKQNEEREGEPDPGDSSNGKTEQELAYIEYRVREIAAFEDRARGKKKRI